MMLLKVISRLDRNRFEPSVLSLMDQGTIGKDIESHGIPVFTLGMKTGIPSVSCVFRLIRLIRQLQPDLIQGWMYHGNIAALLGGVFTKRNVPVLWNIRGSHVFLRQEKPLTAAIIWLSAKFSSFPAKILNNSLSSALLHEKLLGYDATKRVVIPNGFDINVFTPSEEARADVRNELCLSVDTLLIGLFKRYDPIKCHLQFLTAASLLSVTYPNIHFLLVGRGVDSDNEIIVHKIRELGIENKVHLLGERRDMPRLNAALDIATSSSANEGFPNTIGEAMSCGVPCVVTDTGDSSWLVGETGKVIPPRSPDALAEAIGELVSMSASARRNMGMQARQRIADKFSINSIVKQYESVYLELKQDEIL